MSIFFRRRSSSVALLASCFFLGCVAFGELCFSGGRLIGRVVGDRVSSSSKSKFDYYTMELSWWPTLCSGGNRGACNAISVSGGSLMGVYNLSPAALDGSDVSFCGLGGGVINWEDKDLFDAYGHQPFLMQYEWDKHGSCSGLNIRDYFRRVLSLYKKFDFAHFQDRIPLNSSTGSSYDDVVSALGVDANSVVLRCAHVGGKQHLRSVSVSLDKGFSLIPYPKTKGSGSFCSKKSPIFVNGSKASE